MSEPEPMMRCDYCGVSYEVCFITLYGAVYDVSAGTRSGGVAICEACLDHFDRNPDVLMIEVVRLRERLELARTPCKCDPPGSGEEYCTGHCFLNEEIVRIRAALDFYADRRNYLDRFTPNADQPESGRLHEKAYTVADIP